MATMTEEPYVNQVAVRRFYAGHFIGRSPADTAITPVSRTVGAKRAVDEMAVSFTHDVAIDALLPGVPSTGRRVELAIVVVMGFEGGKVAHEHIHWDQACLLVQVGLPDPGGLPVVGVELARKLLGAPEKLLSRLCCEVRRAGDGRACGRRGLRRCGRPFGRRTAVGPLRCPSKCCPRWRTLRWTPESEP